MKLFVHLVFLLLMVSCGGQHVKMPDTPMDADFEPTEPHPFAERIETTTEARLSAADLTWHSDTVGSLVIERTDADTSAVLLRSFSYIDAQKVKGEVNCQYNEFNELSDLWITTPTLRIHNMLQWSEDGNLVSVNQESWIADGLSATAQSHKMLVFEYRYSQHSAYGNWFAGMAEQIGGPIAEAFHAGLLGRAPWTLPAEVTVVCSEISGNMVSDQQTFRCKPQYDFDNNGQVIGETVTLNPASQAYTYKYYYN